MRVIAGEAKGHRLKFVRSARLRPTSDKVKGAIFSALSSLRVDWSRVLDLYAGTGSLGIEALSRGAEYADFVEKDVKFCSIIKENLTHTKMAERSHVYCSPVEKALSFLEGEYTLILLDPPYNDPATGDVLRTLSGSHMTGLNSTIVAEHGGQKSLSEEYGDFSKIKTIHHGDTTVAIYQHVKGGTS